MLLQAPDFGWIAGVVDMKGVVVRKNNQSRATPQIVLIVESRHRDIVVRLSQYTGTNPAVQQERKMKESWKKRGCVEHCPDHHIHIQEVSLPLISRWQITGSSLAVIVYNLLPYLTDSDRTRELQASSEEIAASIPMSGQGRSAIDAALRRLDNLGWQIPSYLLPHEQPLFS